MKTKLSLLALCLSSDPAAIIDSTNSQLSLNRQQYARAVCAVYLVLGQNVQWYDNVPKKKCIVSKTLYEYTITF